MSDAKPAPRGPTEAHDGAPRGPRTAPHERCEPALRGPDRLLPHGRREQADWAWFGRYCGRVPASCRSSRRPGRLGLDRPLLPGRPARPARHGRRAPDLGPSFLPGTAQLAPDAGNDALEQEPHAHTVVQERDQRNATQTHALIETPSAGDAVREAPDRARTAPALIARIAPHRAGPGRGTGRPGRPAPRAHASVETAERR